MPGFLDKNAPNPVAEYSRYIEGDILGKIVLKSFLVHLIGVSEKDIYIPLSRYGDIDTPRALTADAQVRISGKWLDVEIKCAHVNIANRTRGDTNENWAFGKLLVTDARRTKQKYDVLFAAGVLALGLEEPDYWEYLKELKSRHKRAGREFKIDAAPHETDFLTRCGFFVIPHADVSTNYFRITVSAIPESRYNSYFAWGHDRRRAKEIWRSALAASRGT